MIDDNGHAALGTFLQRIRRNTDIPRGDSRGEVWLVNTFKELSYEQRVVNIK